MFSLSSSVALYVVAVAIEGAGVGFVFQPCKFAHPYHHTIHPSEPLHLSSYDSLQRPSPTTALVALQALSPRPDVTVTTSARNWARAVGSAVGVAISTAVQYAVMKASLPTNLPASIRSQVLAEDWTRGGTPAWNDAILQAKMKGVHSVFVLFVPLIGVCLGCLLLIRDGRLLADVEMEKKEEEEEEEDNGCEEPPRADDKEEKRASTLQCIAKMLLTMRAKK
jgi:hypothetical protein